MYNYFEKYNNSGIYPFHMPGHKRFGNAINRFDYTEVEGLDNLYHPNGILAELQNKISRIYGTKQSLLLVNGSTGGILTAITSATDKGDEILVARNCHKSVYNAISLWGLIPHYIQPNVESEINLSIIPNEVEKVLSANSKIKAVVLTSPTYEGVVSDVESIAKVCHTHNAILIVDEAHGSHMKFSEYFPKSAVDCSADLVIHSTHKTLTSLTGTALLHICSDRVSKEILRKRYQTFQTSSPNYLMMASIDECFNNLLKNGEKLFADYIARLDNFYKINAQLKHLKIWEGDGSFGFDRGKLIILTNRSNINGSELQSILRNKYNIETEMSALGYIIAMTSINDTDEGFIKLKNALIEIDNGLYLKKSKHTIKLTVPEYKISAYATELLGHEGVPIEDSVGRISAEYIYAYPPGVPIIVPGELISRKVTESIVTMLQNNINIISESDKLPYKIECTIDT